MKLYAKYTDHRLTKLVGADLFARTYGHRTLLLVVEAYGRCKIYYCLGRRVLITGQGKL